MPGPLTHSPSDIVAQLIIDLGLGSLPNYATNPSWPVFSHNEPDQPDNAITIYDTVGKKNGRTNPDHEIQEHHGIQVRIRSALSDVGYTKARAIAIALDEQVYRESVTIDSTTYCVQCFNRTGDIIAFGKDTPTPSKRFIWTFNGLIMLRKRCS